MTCGTSNDNAHFEPIIVYTISNAVQQGASFNWIYATEVTLNKSSSTLREEYDAKYKHTSLEVPRQFPLQFRFLLRFANLQKHSISVLDLGGGTGEYSKVLQSMGFDVTLADISQAAVDRARALGISNVVCADFLSDDIEVSQYDVVLVRGFSPLNTDDPSRFIHVLQRIDRFVAPGGAILYWGFTDLSQRWTKSGWYNIHPHSPRGAFQYVLVLPAFRYQAKLPVFVSQAISALLLSSPWRLPRSCTLVGIRKRG